MSNFRGPYFVVNRYHSARGPHAQTLPTLNWANVSSPNGHGRFTAWDASDIDAQDMVEALVTAQLGAFPSTVTFDNWTVYHQPTPSDPAQPVAGANFTGMDGTDSTGGWAIATQQTHVWRTQAFGLVKIVLLDSTSHNDFSKTAGLVDAVQIAIDAEFTADSNGWSGQDNSQPLTYVARTKTLNEKLRRSYRLT